MKQPKIKLKTLYEDDGSWWIDIDGNEGNHSRVAISTGLTEQSAWKTAKRRLERMLREVEEQIES